jgi:hypothetical protein
MFTADQDAWLLNAATAHQAQGKKGNLFTKAKKVAEEFLVQYPECLSTESQVIERLKTLRKQRERHKRKSTTPHPQGGSSGNNNSSTTPSTQHNTSLNLFQAQASSGDQGSHDHDDDDDDVDIQVHPSAHHHMDPYHGDVAYNGSHGVASMNVWVPPTDTSTASGAKRSRSRSHLDDDEDQEMQPKSAKRSKTDRHNGDMSASSNVDHNDLAGMPSTVLPHLGHVDVPDLHDNHHDHHLGHQLVSSLGPSVEASQPMPSSSSSATDRQGTNAKGDNAHSSSADHNKSTDHPVHSGVDVDHSHVEDFRIHHEPEVHHPFGGNVGGGITDVLHDPRPEVQILASKITELERQLLSLSQDLHISLMLLRKLNGEHVGL